MGDNSHFLASVGSVLTSFKVVAVTSDTVEIEGMGLLERKTKSTGAS